MKIFSLGFFCVCECMQQPACFSLKTTVVHLLYFLIYLFTCNYWCLHSLRGSNFFLFTHTMPTFNFWSLCLCLPMQMTERTTWGLLAALGAGETWQTGRVSACKNDSCFPVAAGVWLSNTTRDTLTEMESLAGSACGNKALFHRPPCNESLILNKPRALLLLEPAVCSELHNWGHL